MEVGAQDGEQTLLTHEYQPSLLSLRPLRSHQPQSPHTVPITPDKPPRPPPTSPNTTQPPSQPEIVFKTQYHKDAFLIFRALCKLSSKVLPDDQEPTGSTTGLPNFMPSTPTDPLALHSKVLSLTLILGILDRSGKAFNKGDKFVYAVRQYLCVSLLKNCMSHNTSIVYLSLRIFISLVNNFRTNLKDEIEVFLANIFLRVLDSPNSSYEQKCLVLESLSTLTSDPSTLSQIFLSYDCSLLASNDLFKNIVHSLAKVAKGTGSAALAATATQADIEQPKSNAISTFIAGKTGAAKREAGREAR